MNRRSLFLVTGLAAISLLVSAAAAPASVAQMQTTPAGMQVVSSGSLSPETAAETDALAYWTEERMAAAIPMTSEMAGAPQSMKAPREQPMGTPGSMAPAAPVDRAEGQFMAGGSGLQAAAQGDIGAAGYAYPYPFTRYEVFTNYNAWPYSANGKVFFHNTSDNKNYVCSGTAVNSQSKRVVWTAGHCVHGGKGGKWHDKWVFVPARKNGSNPYGVWSAFQLWSLTDWTNNSNLRYDQGAAVINLNSGKRLINVVGGQGIMWNFGRDQHFHDFGYPAASPFAGERMIVCTASHAADDNPGGSGPSTTGIGCDMTGGSSGGGWIVGFPSGYLDGLNSYKYGSQPQAMYSPYFGDGTKNLYNAVANV